MRSALTSISLAVSAIAGAEPPPADHDSSAVTNEPERVPIATVSLSAPHLIAPIVEATAELRVADHLGVAAIGAIGRVNSCEPGDGYVARQLSACSGPPADMFGFGAQLDYYFTRRFSGLHAGIELLYQHLSLATMVDPPPSAVLAGSDASASAFVGYKLLARSGFTAIARGGLGVHSFAGQVQSTTTAMRVEQRAVSPLLGLDVGWSL